MENISFASPFITLSSFCLTEGHCGHFQRETMSDCRGSIRIFISSCLQAMCGCCRISALWEYRLCTNRSARKDWVQVWHSRKSSALRVTRKQILVLELPLTCCVTLKKAGHLFYPQFSDLWHRDNNTLSDYGMGLSSDNTWQCFLHCKRFNKWNLVSLLEKHHFP